VLIKVKKRWTSDGRIILEAFDMHQATKTTGFGKPRVIGSRLVQSMRLPRGTPKHEVRTAMDSLKILAEIKAVNDAELEAQQVAIAERYAKSLSTALVKSKDRITAGILANAGKGNYL
jgi:hypothetical protein